MSHTTTFAAGLLGLAVGVTGIYALLVTNTVYSTNLTAAAQSNTISQATAQGLHHAMPARGITRSIPVVTAPLTMQPMAVQPDSTPSRTATTAVYGWALHAFAMIGGVAALWLLTIQRRSKHAALSALELAPLKFPIDAPQMAMFSATAKVVEPKIRSFICTTTHPVGCEVRVQQEIDYARAHPPSSLGPKKVLIIGCSTGYGLSTRIAAAFGHGAATLGVFLAGPSTKGRPASAGWYNTVAFEKAALKEGLYCKSVNGDAFDPAIKAKTVEAIKQDLGEVDLVVYSVAAPRRVDFKTGQVYKSVLKPIGEDFTNRTLLADKGIVTDVTMEAATPEEVAETVKVMGGEDWEDWMKALADGGVLAKGAKTVAYSYIGPEMTWPVYWSGTIGEAKKDVEKTARRLREQYGCEAYTVVAKALVTQASSAIPVVPLYICLLYKVMKAKGTHEGCIQQMVRMMNTKLYSPDGKPELDSEGRIRLDDWEMEKDVQDAVRDSWYKVESSTLNELADYAGYSEDFLRLFGFGVEGVDYSQPVELDIPLPSASQ